MVLPIKSAVLTLVPVENRTMLLISKIEFGSTAYDYFSSVLANPKKEKVFSGTKLGDIEF